MSVEIIKRIIYDTIDEIGRNKMQIEINGNIAASKKYTNQLLAAYSSRVDLHDPKGAAVCIETVLHFVLTISAIPSERKVKVRDAEIDIVIPSTKTFQKNPHGSLVIQVVSTTDIEHLKKIKDVHPFEQNVWIVSETSIETSFRNYTLRGEPPIADIVVDAASFLGNSGFTGLRILH